MKFKRSVIFSVVGFMAALLAGGACSQSQAAAAEKHLRPPAVPLVTSDPYLSIWSEADHLTDDATRHWTGKQQSLTSLIRVDDKCFRLMGNRPAAAPALPQIRLRVEPTRTSYEFANAQIGVTLTFMTPALPDDLDVLARPVTYISWEVRSLDHAGHRVEILGSASGELAVHSPEQKVEWSRETMKGLTALKIGSQDQPLLVRQGDDTRIDWGYAYLAASTAQAKFAIGPEQTILSQFAEHGDLPGKDDTRMPRAVNDNLPTLAVALDVGSVEATPVSRHMLIAYDEIYSIKFFGQKLRPYWRRNGAGPAELLEAAEHDYARLVDRSTAFDRELLADVTKVGGPRYAEICALAYRQCLAAMGLAADAKGQPLLFTKENTSNGDIATVDVIFPMEPMLLLLSPTLAKASLVPVLNYAASDHWKFPNAPHDLGTYPVAKGTDDGGEGMPVEESGNMLILCDAIARAEGNAEFVAPWWPKLTQWAKYLEQYGLDPEDQLCTDDFMGHLAHNANLSVKAILGLAAYGDLCRLRGDAEGAEKYAALAKKDAEHWLKAAADGPHADHYRLAFDKPNTWSQKYNLAWDRILGLNVFPPDVAHREIEHYKRVMQPFGVPLDSRTRLTKTDWSFWSASLADNRADFEALTSPIYHYLNRTSAREPLVDSYVTDNLKSDGMHARPVVGGIFIEMLTDPEVWKKWAGRDRAKVGPWAPLPKEPRMIDVIATSQHKPAIWRYTEKKPAGNWTSAQFDDKGWLDGPGGFGTRGTPNAVVGTVWKSDDIWLRRQVTMPDREIANLQLVVYHDEDVEIYVNGILAAKASGYDNNYRPMEISRAARAELKPGAKVTLAVHCHQTIGGQGVDVGLAEVEDTKENKRGRH
jgi:hypothetical protein